MVNNSIKAPETAAPEETKQPHSTALPTVVLNLGDRKKKGKKGKPLNIVVGAPINEEQKKKLLDEFEKEVIPGSGKGKKSRRPS